MASRVLLIGGNGFIGSHLVDELLFRGYSVRVLDCNPERFREPLSDVEYIFDDYSSVDVLKKAISGCDQVIHLAHVGTPATSVSDADKEVLSSITAFVKMLEWLKGGMVDRFVFFSSGGAVYGRPDIMPVSEEYKGWPVSPYGVAKLSMEHYLHMFSAINNLQYQIIRPSNPYGPRQNYLGAQGVIPIFMYKILNDLPIEVWGDGKAKKDYVYIDDLARAIVALVGSDQINDTFNISSGEGFSLNQLIEKIGCVCDKTPNVSYKLKQSQDVSEIILSCDKIRSAVGWASEVSIEAGIALTYEWLNDRLGK